LAHRVDLIRPVIDPLRPPAVQTDDDRSAFRVGERDEVPGKIFGLHEDALSVKPLIFRRGEQQSRAVCRLHREENVDLVRTHPTTLTSLE
jgi:hypothetical protein